PPVRQAQGGRPRRPRAALDLLGVRPAGQGERQPRHRPRGRLVPVCRPPRRQGPPRPRPPPTRPPRQRRPEVPDRLPPRLRHPARPVARGGQPCRARRQVRPPAPAQEGDPLMKALAPLPLVALLFAAPARAEDVPPERLLPAGTQVYL